MKVYITGVGLLSALGKGEKAHWTSLEARTSPLKNTLHLPEQRKSIYAGKVPLESKDLEEKYQLNQPVHRSALLGLEAALDAIENKMLAKRRACIFGSTLGGINPLENQPELWINQSREYEWLHTPEWGTGWIAKRTHFEHYHASIATACSTSANALMLGARLIRNGRVDMVLAGGAESLENYTINGFDALQLLDPERCRPFSENRKGLNLGEAGAFLLLESEASVKDTKNEILAELIGWGNACDAYHQTASSPSGDGAYYAMLDALRVANIAPDKIEYVNAHGTGTLNNDASEYAAMEKIFHGKIPWYSSTKSYTGHTLAAAGGVEAILTLWMMKNHTIFPGAEEIVPMNSLSTAPIQHKIAKSISIAMSNSFGFGGNCTELIFQR